MEKDFTILLTGTEDSTALARAYLEQTRENLETVIAFKLPYTLPFNRFTGIRQFQLLTKYRPFLSEPRTAAVVILDLSEWIGHEEEEYLRIFFCYLHDHRGFFKPEYILTLGRATKQEAQKIFCLASEYLRTGMMVEDRTLLDREKLSRYLKKKYPLEAAAADTLAGIYLQKEIPSLRRVQLLTEDLLLRANTDRPASERQLAQTLPDSKLSLFYGAGVKSCFWEQKEMEGDNERHS